MTLPEIGRRFLTIAATVLFLSQSVAQAAIWYVKANATGAGTGVDWANAFPTFQQALAAAAAGDEVWVAEGTYVTPTMAGFAINTRLQIYGGFKGTETSHNNRLGSFLNTVLEGDIGLDGNPLNNAGSVITVTTVPGINGGPGLLIDGVRIQNGYAQAVGACGAGILSIQTDLSLVNCFVRSNSAPAMSNNNFGGGLYFTSFSAGVAPSSGYRLRIKTCEFRSNYGSRGGAIYADRARGEVVNSQFIENHGFPYGAGAYLTRMGTSERLDFTNCAFWQNTCTMTASPPEPGAALYLGDNGAGTGGNTQVVNCTFSDNLGPSGVAGQAMVVSTNSAATVYNSIFWWNGTGGSGSPAPVSGSPTIDYSDIEGGWGSGSNISADPLFADHTTGRLSLKNTTGPPALVSPCLDAADYSKLPVDALDLDGDGNVQELTPLDLANQSRTADQGNVNDSGVGTIAYMDMGAYERP